MMENMKIYNAVRRVPQEALKTIRGGRLNGYSDINPMFRVQALTEQFGACGIGWYYEITRQWLEKGANENTVCAFCNINLYIKVNNEWSKPIPGTGGASFISPESKGAYTSDECWKMALTDAISVSAKALGVGADIYWQDGRTKYSVTTTEQEQKPKAAKAAPAQEQKPAQPEPEVPGGVAADTLPSGLTDMEYNGFSTWLNEKIKKHGITAEQYMSVVRELHSAGIIRTGKKADWTKAEWKSVCGELKIRYFKEDNE